MSVQAFATVDALDRVTRQGESAPAPAMIEDGLNGLQRSLIRPVSGARTIGKKFETLVSLAGRAPLELGLLGLSPYQEAFYRALHDSEPEATSDGAAQLALGVAASGRLLLMPLADFVASELLLDSLPVSAADLRAVEVEQQRLAGTAAPFESEMECELATWSDATAQVKAARIAESLDHVDPILVFFEDEVLTNTPDENNLLKGRGGVDAPEFLLSRLVQLPLADWSPNARTFVYCFDLILDAGYRGEELNSQYLSPQRVDAFFERMLARCREASPDQAIRSGLGLREKAVHLRELRAKLRESQQYYRWVHGITLQKEQYSLPRGELSPFLPGALPREINAFLSDFLDVSRHSSCSALFHEFVASVSAGASVRPALLGLHPIEALIVAIVAAANDDIASDIGMSRCLRDLSQLVRVHREDQAEEANGWPQSDYFCAVVPGRALRSNDCEANRSLRNVFKAISARMRFNSWHYMPGHFARERCAADRHFYFPPALPDTAEWSDQRHRGHIAAEVRYSIRSPAPLLVEGKLYPGMLDLRLMRREGNPYTPSELKRAIAYTGLLQALYQAVLDVGVETGKGHAVVGFGNSWFESVNWKELP